MRTEAVKALLFDLGGVVVEIDFGRAFRHWANISSLSAEELRNNFRFDVAYQQHERGELSAALYFDGLRKSLRLDGSDEQIAAGWNAIFVAEIAATLEAIRKARAKYPCYLFTNSNATHQLSCRSRFPRVVASFDRVFVSSEIGLRKPERAAFEFIARAVALPADTIVFFDDLAENVAGAIEAGFQAVLVKSTADVHEVLVRLGCEV